jgi:23S rRNA (guanosine2251-2'-O)-methyltransferase
VITKLPHDDIPRRSLDEVRKSPRHPIYVLLNNLRSVYNVGSIFRTSDAANIQQIIITGYTAVPPRKDMDKTALGSTESVAWVYEPNPLEAIAKLKSQGVKIAALEIATPSVAYTDVPPDFPICLVVGNEVSGVDDDVLALCDFAIEIPQFGMKQSMNVAVAYGIAVFGLVDIFKKSKA